MEHRRQNLGHNVGLGLTGWSLLSQKNGRTQLREAGSMISKKEYSVLLLTSRSLEVDDLYVAVTVRGPASIRRLLLQPAKGSSYLLTCS